MSDETHEPRRREAMTPPHRCEACGLDYYYAPKFHECADPDLALPTESWAEECMRKQRG